VEQACNNYDFGGLRAHDSAKDLIESQSENCIMPLRKLILSVATASLVSLASVSNACDTDPLCNIIFENSVSTFENSIIGSLPLVVDERRIVSVNPVLIPDFFQQNSGFTSLDSMDDLFVEVPSFSVAGVGDLVSYVTLFKEKIEVDEPEDQEEPEALTEARSYLQSGAFEIYQEFRSKYLSRVVDLQEETNGSAKNLIRIEIEQIERDWELFGNRIQVEAAISVIERFAAGNVSLLFAEWDEILNDNPPSFSQMLERSLAETNWIAFGYSSSDIEDVTVRLLSDQGRSELQGLRYLSFSAKLVPVGRNYLYHPFVSSKGWSVDDQSKLLVPEGSGNTGKVGWYVLGAIVVKNMELLTSADVEPAIYEEVSVFPTGSKGSFQSNSISLSSPYIVGLVVERLKEFPSK